MQPLSSPTPSFDRGEKWAWVARPLLVAMMAHLTPASSDILPLWPWGLLLAHLAKHKGYQDQLAKLASCQLRAGIWKCRGGFRGLHQPLWLWHSLLTIRVVTASGWWWHALHILAELHWFMWLGLLIAPASTAFEGNACSGEVDGWNWDAECPKPDSWTPAMM